MADDQKPAARQPSPASKLDALADAAAAAESEESSTVGELVKPQPSEVTPANTFECSPKSERVGLETVVKTGDSTEAAASTSVAVASAAAALPPPLTAAAQSTTTETDSLPSPTLKSCPWKNRQDLLALWQKRHAQLQSYHAQHGHVNVPQRYPPNPELGRWVKDQRAFRRNGKLSQERIALLDALGFCWKLKRPDDFWSDKFAQLQRYKGMSGSTNPPREGEWKLLACWVDRQRRAGRRGKLSQERVELLNGVGFVWDPRGGAGGGGDKIVGCDSKKKKRSSAKSPSKAEPAGSNTTNSSSPVPNAFTIPMQPSYQDVPGMSNLQGMNPNNPMNPFPDPMMHQRMMMQHQGGGGMQGSRMQYPSNMQESYGGVGGSGGGMNNPYPFMSQMGSSSFPPGYPGNRNIMTSNMISGMSGGMGGGQDMSSSSSPDRMNTVSMSNHPSMQERQSIQGGGSQVMSAYVPEHLANNFPYPNIHSNTTMPSSSSQFYPPQYSRNYTYPSSEDHAASLSRSQQLRIMLAEEEERQASITRTQQLRAMLEEEERRLFMMGGGGGNRYEYGYGYGMDSGQMPPHPQQMQPQQQQQLQQQQMRGPQANPSRDSNDGSNNESKEGPAL